MSSGRTDEALVELLQSLARAREDEAKLFRLVAARLEQAKDDPALMIAEAAELLGVDQSTVARLVLSGELPHYNATGTTKGKRILLSAVREFQRRRSA